MTKTVAWGTWTPERPAELRHLVSGFRILPLLYSTRAAGCTDLPPGPEIALGPRALDNSTATFSVDFADTRLDWTYGFPSPDKVIIHWKTRANGEWGLRFWVVLCVQSGNHALLEHVDNGHLLKLVGEKGTLNVLPDSPPTLVTFHECWRDVAKEFEHEGYFFLGSRGRSGNVAALRFNLEQSPDNRLMFTLGYGTDAPPETAKPVPRKQSTCHRSLQAVHDVISWNHVWDEVNERQYTALTRFWSRKKFGGFGVWLNDTLFNALMWSQFDHDRAVANFEAATAWQTEAGNFPCLVTGNDIWNDSSQIPMAAHVAWSIFARSGDLAFLRQAYPRIVRNNRWWRKFRSLRDTGFVTYGTSRGVGNGLYRGTRIAAQNESTMDNSPLHDQAPFDRESGLLLTVDVGLNSLFALDCEYIGHMATLLGREEEAAAFQRKARTLAGKISDELWDEERQVFANRLMDGTYIRSITPTSFFPLVAGAATSSQVRQLVDHYLGDERNFGGRLILPSVTRDDPAYRDNVYWRGRIWGPLNYWCYAGLRRMGLEESAALLARHSRLLFEQGWRSRHCGENYNAESGRITDQPDSDTFYSWGALLPLLATQEVAHIDPWNGFSLTPARAEGEFGPVASHHGSMIITGTERDWQVAFAERGTIQGSISGRLDDIAITSHAFEATLPAGGEGEWIRLSFLVPRLAKLGKTELSTRDDVITLPGRSRPLRLVLQS